MAFPSIYLELLVGETKPTTKAPAKIMGALVQAEVEQTDAVPCGFQLVFESALDATGNEYSLMNESALENFGRAALVVHVGDQSSVLIDGYITNKELDPATGMVTVTGEDVSVKMDLVELVAEYKSVTDSVIAKDILGKYAALGLTAEVKGPKNEITPVEFTETQRYTDRQYLVRLAQKNDALFYVQPGSAAGQNTAYWGPPVRRGTAQRNLSDVSGAIFGPVSDFKATYDSLATELNYGEKASDGGEGKESKEARFAATSYEEVALAKVPPELKEFANLAMAPETARNKAAKLKVKGKYIYQLGLQPGAADTTAQSLTDRSTGRSVTLTGTVDAANYGAVLQAPGLVGVRAAGESFSGDYYVKKVKHSFNLRRSDMQYTQSFTLTREGLGAKSGTVK